MILQSRMNVLPPVVKNLMIINGLFYLGTVSVKKTFGIDLADWLGLYFPGSQNFMPHQLVTHMFMHGSFGHVLSNMFMLWMFGKNMEVVWGGKRFLIYYFATGLGASFLYLGVNAWEYFGTMNALGIDSISAVDNGVINSLYNQGLRGSAESLYKMQYVPMVGASGAVFGILLAFGMTFPNQYIYLNFFLPMKAKYFVAAYGLFELYNSVNNTNSGIAHFAHLGGMLFGILLILKWRRERYI